MRKIGIVLGGIAVVLAIVITLQAQTAISVRPIFSRTPVSTTADDLAVMLAAVEQTTPTAAESVPVMGTFQSAQNPLWPPLPGNLNNTPAWNLGDGVWLLDDLDVDYSASRPLRSGGGMHAMDDSGPPSPGDGDGGTNTYDYEGSGFAAQVFTTNDLFLQILGVTNGIASIIIHQPWNVTNGVYDLWYCTNLAPPVAWQWVLRTEAGQTNLLVPNATDAQGFYAIRPPNDLAATDSEGTNFWFTFFGLGDSGANGLSVYISSPVGATGTVTMPGLQVNDTTFIVTNCADTTVNGTYVLTNLTPEEAEDWTDSGSLETNWIYYEKGADWVGFNGDYWQMFAYDSSAHDITFLYFKDGLNLNGSDTDWQYENDTNPPPTPTSLCTEFSYIPFTLAAGTLTNISFSLEPQAMIGIDDVVETNGIQMTASAPVAVFGLDYYPTESAAFTAYPTTLLGTNYCLMARAAVDGYANNYSRFALVATIDDTTVTITPSSTANLIGSLWTNAFTLQQGQTYQISSSDYSGDVTGTKVTSDKPIAVFAGANLAFVPYEYTSTANPLVQEQLPVSDWGTQALALPLAGRTGGDTYRVLAANNNTVVLTNGVVAGTNQAGQFLDFIIDGPVEFQASQPIQVAQFANGYTFDHSSGPFEGDPCETLLLPTGHYLETNTVFTLDNTNEDFDENFLNVIVTQSAITNTLVDGFHVAATNFVAIGTSGYYGAQVTLTNSTHKVISSQPVGVQVYGFGIFDAYSYIGGVVK